MSILKIYKYPHPVLREPCAPITDWNGELQKLVDDMIETMYAQPGAVGLAACQVGSPVQLIVMDVTAKTTRDQLKILINPTVTSASRNKVSREGCLSFPEYLANIKRATRLSFEAHDRDEQKIIYEVRDFEAVAVQHEMDHLNGVLMIDRVESLKTDLVRRQAPAVATEESAEA